MGPNETLVSEWLIGGFTALFLTLVIGGFLQTRRSRLLMHAERMKALDLGRELPDDAEMARLKVASQVQKAGQADEAEVGEKSFASRCYSTTAGICGTGFVFAWLSGSNQAVALTMAAATGAVGVTGMICGTILATRPEPSRESRTASNSKPMYDPEAV